MSDVQGDADYTAGEQMDGATTLSVQGGTENHPVVAESSDCSSSSHSTLLLYQF